MLTIFSKFSISLYSSKEIENVENTVNIEMSNIHEWLCTNRLSINLSKTDCMVFNKIKARSMPSIYINNHKTELTDNVEFLGVFIDSHLNWKKHIRYVTSKLRTISFVLFQASKVLICRSLKIIYFSLFYPHIDYCCEVWGCSLYITYIP